MSTAAMDDRLKERLVGAIVLVAAAVIFIPILLNLDTGSDPVSSGAPKTETAGTDASRDNGGSSPPAGESASPAFSSRVTPLSQGQSPGSGTSATAKVAEKLGDTQPATPQLTPALPGPGSANTSKVTPVPAVRPVVTPLANAAPERSAGPAKPARPAPKPASPPSAAAPKPVSQAKPAGTAEAGARSGGWVVQLASFGKAQNALALRDKLRQQGFEAFTGKATTANGAVTRVYIGPEPDKAAARALIEPLRSASRLAGIVVSNPVGKAQ